MDITEKLNRLASLQAHVDKLKEHYAQLRADALPDTVRDLLQEIDQEQAGAIGPALLEIDELACEIKNDVLQGGRSVRGAHLQAIYSPGAPRWDDRALAGYAEAHPEILKWRKAGAPSVSLRAVTR